MSWNVPESARDGDTHTQTLTVIPVALPGFQKYCVVVAS